MESKTPMDDRGLVPMETSRELPSMVDPPSMVEVSYSSIRRRTFADSVDPDPVDPVDLDSVVPMRRRSRNVFTRVARWCFASLRQAAHERDVAMANHIAKMNREAEASRLAKIQYRKDYPEVKTESDGRTEWRIDGKLGRYDDKPAVVTDTTSIWYWAGLMDRHNKPAYIEVDGAVTETRWYCKGKLMRLDGPAYLTTCKNNFLSEERWYKHGVLTRDDDLPAVTVTHIRNRTTRIWFVCGVPHRFKGYAVIGAKLQQWRLGKLYSDEDRFDSKTWEHADRVLKNKQPNEVGRTTYTYWPNGNKQSHTYRHDVYVGSKRQNVFTVTNWWKNGKLKSHSVGGLHDLPVLNRNYDRFTIIKSELYTYDQDGLLHSYNGRPAVAVYNNKCTVEYGRIHSAGRDLIVAYYAMHGKLHRVSGPAYMRAEYDYNPYSGYNTVDVVFAWYDLGNLHRRSGDMPAVVHGQKLRQFNPNEWNFHATYEAWFDQGNPYRVNEYAVVVGRFSTRNPMCNYIRDILKKPKSRIIKCVNMPDFPDFPSEFVVAI